LAHASTGQLITAGRDEAISIVVNAETTAPMVGVDVTIPRGFTISSLVPAIGGGGQRWAVSRDGDVMRYRGQGIAEGGALYVELMGRAAAAGSLSFATVTRAADGTVVSWSGPASSDHPAAMVQVVSGPGSVGPSRGRSWPGSRAAAAGAALAVLATLAVAWRRRRLAAQPS
jgi:hypothetical protein